jgi:predicted HNH restriction endonuclease
MNNGKYHTLEYKLKQEAKVDNRFGPIKEHKKVCQCCGNEFIFKGRLNTKQYESARFCSRSCANNRQRWWDKDNNIHRSQSYRAIAMRHHVLECVVCGFNKIVAIHHIDENKQNNDPSNLIPLCPNHHEMVHSKWKEEIIPYITEWQSNMGN